jgi:hypothetical protein
MLVCDNMMMKVGKEELPAHRKPKLPRIYIINKNHMHQNDRNTEDGTMEDVYTESVLTIFSM